MKNKIKLWVGLSIKWISLKTFDELLNSNALQYEQELGMWAVKKGMSNFR